MLNVSSNLPGMQCAPAMRIGSELQREDVLLDGTYVGQIVYVQRKHKIRGSEYGWRPARARGNVRLVTKVDAVRAVLRG